MEYTFDNYGEYFKDFFTRYDYPAEARNTLLVSFEKVRANSEAAAVFKQFIADYDDGATSVSFFAKGRERAAEIASRLGFHKYTAELLIYLCIVPSLERKYEEKGLSKDIFYNSLIDLRCKLMECYKLHGVWGQFVNGWFNGFFTLDRFGLGRLQFEVRKYFFITRCGGHLLLPGRKMINLHIPSSGPLSEEEVTASFEKAYEFFRDRFKTKYILFHVSSWLLFEEHRKMLPPTSNIVKFMDRFQVAMRFPEPANNDFWRIFYRKYDKNNPDFSGNTALEKGYAKLLSEGKHMGGAVGIFLYDGKEFVKGKDTKRKGKQ